MFFESRPSQQIDTFIPNSECSAKNLKGANTNNGQIEDRISSFLARNSQSLNMIQSENNGYQINTYSERNITQLIQKRLCKENQQKLNDFAQTFIFVNDHKINFVNPPQESLRTNIKSLLSSNGAVFIGEVDSNGQKQGKGVLLQADGSYYFGDFYKDKMNGLGVLVQKNQERYEGEYVQDQQTGKGEYHYLNGDQYIGCFDKGLKHGQGKIIYYEICASYIGDFVNDKREGQGLMIGLNGNIIQDGYFKNDQFIQSSKQMRSQASKNLSNAFSSVDGQAEQQNNQQYNSHHFSTGGIGGRNGEEQIEMSKIEIVTNDSKIQKDLFTNNQNSSQFKAQQRTPSNTCCCSLLPFDLFSFLKIS